MYTSISLSVSLSLYIYIYYYLCIYLSLSLSIYIYIYTYIHVLAAFQRAGLHAGEADPAVRRLLCAEPSKCQDRLD